MQRNKKFKLRHYLQLRSSIGVENLMWGSDYPHAESTFPKSREIVERLLKDVSARERTIPGMLVLSVLLLCIAGQASALQPGDKAPDFALPATTADMIGLL